MFKSVEGKYGIKIPNDLKQYMEIKEDCVMGRLENFDKVIILFQDGDNDGDVVDKPIADSLQDLLNRLEVIDLK